MHGAELGGGICAELVGESPPRVLEDGECFGLPAASVQCPHELPAQAFPQGMRGRQLLELRNETAVPAERQLRLGMVLDGRDP
jgi:hypothetical protein